MSTVTAPGAHTPRYALRDARRLPRRDRQLSAIEVARLLWDLVDSCVDALDRATRRGGPSPDAHLTELRRAMLRSTRTRADARRRQETVDTVIALLRSQLDDRTEPPIIPLVAPGTGRPTLTSLDVVRGLRRVDRALQRVAA